MASGFLPRLPFLFEGLEIFKVAFPITPVVPVILAFPVWVLFSFLPEIAFQKQKLKVTPLPPG